MLHILKGVNYKHLSKQPENKTQHFNRTIQAQNA